jgi:hypothetical protein
MAAGEEDKREKSKVGLEDNAVKVAPTAAEVEAVAMESEGDEIGWSTMQEDHRAA